MLLKREVQVSVSSVFTSCFVRSVSWFWLWITTRSQTAIILPLLMDFSDYMILGLPLNTSPDFPPLNPCTFTFLSLRYRSLLKWDIPSWLRKRTGFIILIILFLDFFLYISVFMVLMICSALLGCLHVDDGVQCRSFADTWGQILLQMLCKETGLIENGHMIVLFHILREKLFFATHLINPRAEWQL